MSDILTRLELEARRRNWDEAIPAMIEAEAEIRKLRAALKPFAEASERNLGHDDCTIVGDCTLGDLRAAAAALKETDNA